MFLKTDDADLFITSMGNGPRTFVAHGGWVGSGELWQLPFESMSRSWRCVTYDHRGTGASRHRGEITMQVLVDDLFRVLDHLDIGQCVLAGESSGATIALEAVLREPKRFSSLVLVDGRYQRARTPGAERMLQGCKLNFEATMDAFIAACTPEEDCAAERAWGKKIVMRSNGPDAVQLMECLEVSRVEERLREVSVPTLLIHGTRDVITPIENSEHMAREIPGARLVRIEGAGHVPTITRPAEVVRAIDEFFR